MDKPNLDSVCQQIYRQHPEFKGKHPRVRALTNGNSSLVFETRVTTADGHPLPRTLRVTVDETGKILKISTSRG
mgnify:FL=1